MNERDAERERRAAQYEDAVEAGAVLPLPEGVQYPDEELRYFSKAYRDAQYEKQLHEKPKVWGDQ